jgi:hypothetical protein
MGGMWALTSAEAIRAPYEFVPVDVHLLAHFLRADDHPTALEGLQHGLEDLGILGDESDGLHDVRAQPLDQLLREEHLAHKIHAEPGVLRLNHRRARTDSWKKLRARDEL